MINQLLRKNYKFKQKNQYLILKIIYYHKIIRKLLIKNFLLIILFIFY
jgi:hypothetical protein